MDKLICTFAKKIEVSKEGVKTEKVVKPPKVPTWTKELSLEAYRQ